MLHGGGGQGGCVMEGTTSGGGGCTSTPSEVLTVRPACTVAACSQSFRATQCCTSQWLCRCVWRARFLHPLALPLDSEIGSF